jgi:hypothetical protein
VAAPCETGPRPVFIFPETLEIHRSDPGGASAYLPPSKPGWHGLLSDANGIGCGACMSGTGLQKLAYFLLVALILVVAATGGG